MLAGAWLSAAGLSGLFLFQIVAMALPLGIFHMRNKRGAFDAPDDAKEWPAEIWFCAGDEYLGTIMKSHLVCVTLGGMIPFCGLPCLPVVWLWSFIYFPGFKTRRRTKVHIYAAFQVIGLFYWYQVLVRCRRHFLDLIALPLR